MNINDFLGDMPKDLNEYEIARYIYIELGKYFSYDERYITQEDLDDKKKIYNKNPNEIYDNKVVCSSLSKIYSKLLNSKGIKTEIIHLKGKFLGHDYTQITIDGKDYYTDLIHDLTYIKKGFKTLHFMKLPLNDKLKNSRFEELTDEQLKKMDSKINYTYHGMYMDDTIKLLNKDMQALSDNKSEYGQELSKTLGTKDMSLKELVEYKINFIKEHFPAEDLNSVEKVDYFMELLKVSATLDEHKRFDFSKISCLDKDSNMRQFLIIKDKILKDKMIYTFTDSEYANKVEGDIVKRLLDSGLRTISSKEEVKKELLDLTVRNDRIFNKAKQRGSLYTNAQNQERTELNR